MACRPTTAESHVTTSERLIEAATAEFADKGLKDANLRDICALADVNLNAVRYHFGGKEALYVAAVKHAHRSVMGDIRPPSDESTSPEDRLREIISMLLNLALGQQRPLTAEHKLMHREFSDPTEATVQVARAFAKPMFMALRSAISEMLPADTSAIERNMLTTSVIGQCMHFKFGRQIDELIIPKSEFRKFTMKRLTDHIYRVTLAAIRDYSA
ncbi:CerR family C-terminal domain-containing protein [Rhodopirellula bahusiensis]|uniref:HTH tetR-type domain-containing protein n=1 Tax=Rhodopirellula bahusiensis TaxID=2014065 RepID=A0A2G1VZM2_9BACT|nr:CerR family C-terminal domain-containing protein [Rhodopirellula bahusiensis]PHQ32238.1 hypothetical protein CEE69_26830 [Rhodopirellula bahusiensis]